MSAWRKKVAGAVNKLLGEERNGRKKSQEDANVVIGPVIGKVTSTSARILLEIDREARITVSLTQIEDAAGVLRSRQLLQQSRRRRRRAKKDAPAAQDQASAIPKEGDQDPALPGRSKSKQGRSLKVEKKLPANRPVAFEFLELSPGCRYLVELEGCKSDLVARSSFVTFPRKEELWDRVNVGVVSCNKIFITQMEIPIHSDLWADLAKNIEAGSVDLVLHLGDQVYGDGDKLMDKENHVDRCSDRFRLCKEDIMKDVPRHLWHTKEEEVREAYREVYRETWRHPPTARCLANCPNLMIYDDHEIRDNWADLEADWDPECLDFFIARGAWIAYLEYQRQLDRDIDFRKLHKLTKDHHFHVVGGLGLMFLDVRGCRSFQRVKGDEFPYLGSPQWTDIDQALRPGDLFEDVRVLLVCSPAPLVFLEPNITDAAGKNVPRLADFRGHWSADMHRKEQTRMIEALVNWKESGRREVMVLGGDVHCGGHSQIFRGDQVLLNQFTTSAIANRPLPKPAYYFMRAAGRLGVLGNDYKFKHHHWTRSRNYGLMGIRSYRTQDPGNVVMVSQLVIGKFVGGIIQGEVVSNSETIKVKCGCFEAHG
ncbi:uncharacterized protein LOC9651288 [Selaginella moellendorffii]|uniref:uncharacterized protein LOC9651288 n=1 Tax=Selaginella moellendorffii TaxID=88036 RepID=UPI000D1CE178|nr:uncharacterized protein LOC9651288 [Selaginella moellendorffii]|eukprot:XP_024533319.1 uncharacterized protein LOC9651288 [Selaginella moellendorffii]